MSKTKVVANIVSNWAGLLIGVAVSFLVSPVIVHSLGNELYGVWTLVVSVTGYFTVLDFGVNTAIVRYISSSTAVDDRVQARRIYSTSMAIFATVAVAVVIFSLIFGYFFRNVFKLYHIPHLYLYAVFVFAAVDLACGLLFSVFLGCLCGLQEFKFINGISVVVTFVKYMTVMYLLSHGYGLLTLALLQVSGTIIRALCQYLRLKVKHSFLTFSWDCVTRQTVKLIFSYSVYSFIIAVALKFLFYTDSLVIGTMIGVANVTYYAIPSGLLDYLGQFVWAMISVLVPIISANDATGEQPGNLNLYVMGTRYTLLITLPAVISLYFYGDDFIRLWMGPQIALHSHPVLRLLLIGFAFSISQLIAHGILKGISKHKALACILILQAAVNLAMSLTLSRKYGIEGVAFATMVPLILASFAIIFYTCHILQLKVWVYLLRSYTGGLAATVVALLAVHLLEPGATSYGMVFLKSGAVTLAFLAVAVPLGLPKEHAALILSKIKRLRLPTPQ